jgi:hypothetical protein
MGVEGEVMKRPFESTLDGYGKSGRVLVPVEHFCGDVMGLHILADFVAKFHLKRSWPDSKWPSSMIPG